MGPFPHQTRASWWIIWCGTVLRPEDVAVRENTRSALGGIVGPQHISPDAWGMPKIGGDKVILWLMSGHGASWQREEELVEIQCFLKLPPARARLDIARGPK
jgi:hypothetical protein